MKIAKILKRYFNVSMTRVDDKRINILQVSNGEIKPKAKVTKTSQASKTSKKFNIVETKVFNTIEEEYEIDEFEEPINPKTKASKTSKKSVIKPQSNNRFQKNR